MENFLIGAYLGDANIESVIALQESGADYVVLTDRDAGNCQTIRSNSSIPVAILTEITEPDKCDQYIAAKTADLIVLDKQLICDPYWPNKLQLGKVGNVRFCMNCGYCTVPATEIMHCAINPYAGYEYKYTGHHASLAAKIKRIIVIGGGPSGMQAAITASQKGHNVILIEKSEELGGRLLREAPETAGWFVDEMKQNHVDARLGVTENEKYILSFKPDLVIFSIGEKSNNETTISALQKKGIPVINIGNEQANTSIGNAIRSGFCIANGI